MGNEHEVHSPDLLGLNGGQLVSSQERVDHEGCVAEGDLEAGMTKILHLHILAPP